MRFLSFLNALAFLGMLMCATGCGNSGIVSYDAPKSELDALIAASRATPSGSAEIQWIKPKEWEPLPLTAFRKGNFKYSPAGSDSVVSISISSLPGEAGDLLSNVNKWRGQLNLAPLSRKNLEEEISRRRFARFDMAVLEIQAPSSEGGTLKTVAAVFKRNGLSWQIKMMGEADLVEDQRSQFEAFLSSLSFAQPVVGNDRSGDIDAEPHLSFQAPEEWVPAPKSPYRLASFAVRKEGLPSADFSIAHFPGDAGGIMANVNRWRKQLDLEEWTSYQIGRRGSKIAKGELEFLLYDLKPESDAEKERSSDRILAAILSAEGSTWFFKLKGDPFLVETQRNRFKELLRSVSFSPETEATE